MDEAKYIKVKIRVLESLSNDFSDKDGINISGEYWKSIRSELYAFGIINIAGGDVWGFKSLKRDAYLVRCKMELESLKHDIRNRNIYYAISVVSLAISIISLAKEQLLKLLGL
jgi:hypothetical protein